MAIVFLGYDQMSGVASFQVSKKSEINNLPTCSDSKKGNYVPNGKIKSAKAMCLEDGELYTLDPDTNKYIIPGEEA